MTPAQFKSARMDMGLDPKELAAKVGCTKRTIDRLEAGDCAIDGWHVWAMRGLVLGSKK